MELRRRSSCFSESNSSSEDPDPPKRPDDPDPPKHRPPERPTPTAHLDRSHDCVYESTTCVVRAVMTLSQNIHSVSAYLDNVRAIGVQLRQLLANVDHLMPAFPSQSHRNVSVL